MNRGIGLLEFVRRRLVTAARRRNPGLSPRRWSNAQLRQYAGEFEGDIINVSGWRDLDKEGGCYRNYFSRASSYTISNYWGSKEKNDGAPDAVFLDLEAPLPESLNARFDVVFAHTVLEHVYDVQVAFRNMALMSRDVILLVVPFMQDEHYSDGIYGDYWRFTPLGLKRVLAEHGFELVHLNANDSPWYPVYLVAVASRNPGRWQGKFPVSYDWSRRIGELAFHYPGSIR